MASEVAEQDAHLASGLVLGVDSGVACLVGPDVGVDAAEGAGVVEGGPVGACGVVEVGGEPAQLVRLRVAGGHRVPSTSGEDDGSASRIGGSARLLCGMLVRCQYGQTGHL
jgi:hypothetical protein